MKTLHLSLKKEILLVEEDLTDSGDICTPLTTKFNGQDLTLIGKLPDLTEEDLHGIVGEGGKCWGLGDPEGYVNYIDDRNAFQFAKDSFESAIEAKGCHLKNPLGTFEDFDKQVYNHSTKKLTEWKAAESRTFHPELTYIFEIVK